MNFYSNYSISPPMTSSSMVVSGSTSAFPSSMYGSFDSVMNAIPQPSVSRGPFNLSAAVPSIDEDDSNSNGKPQPKNGKKQGYYSAEVLADGYHYRKYGQKFSRSSPYPTCYYKCAHPGCPVKRHISRDADGKLNNHYRGSHTHVPPQIRRVEVTSQEEFISVVTEECKFLGDWVESEGPTATEKKSSSERKLVVVAKGPVDTADDSFHWKKYGSKIVKSSTVQKSYYRCAHPACPAKRLIQKPTDTKGDVETTVVYQGAHNHPIAPREPKVEVVQSGPVIPEDVIANASPLLAATVPETSLGPMGVLTNGQRVLVVPTPDQSMSSALLYSTGLGSIWDNAVPQDLHGGAGMELSNLPSIPPISAINTFGV
ncbi:WRKY DNA -binding domain [Carpediemonas membranifera]|uniref:WRKY DNA -binding domain n=1 Tax=Carpediemonas membranifera TaxID=201153 RepID=A0A8J6BE46_9EUKA|nr:WRKY DNA -binding domain [Carpediemonas membranifera]|eukprot:KAG9395577.1 WRKY DNA -binding domain [Carpediemonas membranifera]